MKLFVAFVALIVVLVSGCRKQTPKAESADSQSAGPAATPEQQQAPGAVPQPGEPAGTPAAAAPPQNPNEQLVGMVHGFMTQQLRIFVKQTGRMPQNFREFTSTRMDSVPRPPEGFRWAIDEQTVEVKLVR